MAKIEGVEIPLDYEPNCTGCVHCDECPLIKASMELLTDKILEIIFERELDIALLLHQYEKGMLGHEIRTAAIERVEGALREGNREYANSDPDVDRKITKTVNTLHVLEYIKAYELKL